MLIPQFPVSFLPLFFNLNCGALKVYRYPATVLPAASSEVQQYDPPAYSRGQQPQSGGALKAL